jgi:hypothetical protein
MEPEGLLPPPLPVLSQIAPATAPHITAQKSVLVLISHLIVGFSRGHISSSFLTKTLYAPLLYPHVLHVLPISVFLIWSPE